MIRYGLIGGALLVAVSWGADYASRRVPPVEFLPGNGITVPGGVVHPYRMLNDTKTPSDNEVSWNPKRVHWTRNQFLGFSCAGKTRAGFYGPSGAYFPADDERDIRIPTDKEIEAGGLYNEPRPIIIPAKIVQYPPGDWDWGPESRLWCLPWQRIPWFNIVVPGPRLRFRVETATP